MGSYTPEPQPLWIETPCIPSPELSRVAGCNIFLKLENLQPSGSFKSRGIGNMMQRALLAHQASLTSTTPAAAAAAAAAAPADSIESAEADEDARNNDPSAVHFYISSGGNAGLACATAALALSQEGSSRCTCTIFVPATAPAHTVAKLRSLGAVVIQVGPDWAVADRHLRAQMHAAHGEEGSTVCLEYDPSAEAALLKKTGTGEESEVILLKVPRKAGVGVYVPPFDNPHVWEGASTLVDEIVKQTAEPLARLAGSGSGISNGNSGKVDGIVCSVGGGGLLSGIMEGIERHFPSPDSDNERPHVLAVETAGADSLSQSVRAGKLVSLPAITSVATSLGAVRVAERAFQCATAKTKSTGQPLLTSHVIPDKDAVLGLVRFADDARMLVEVACGAAVAPVYNGDLRRTLGKGLDDAEWKGRNVVLVVCGGSNITLGMVDALKERFGVE